MRKVAVEPPESVWTEMGRLCRAKVFILLPVLNEAANIGGPLDRIDGTMREAGLSYAVILA